MHQTTPRFEGRVRRDKRGIMATRPMLLITGRGGRGAWPGETTHETPVRLFKGQRRQMHGKPGGREGTVAVCAIGPASAVQSYRGIFVKFCDKI